MLPEYTQFNEMVVIFTALDKEAEPLTPQSLWSTHKWYFCGPAPAIAGIVLFIVVPMVAYLSYVVHLVGFYVSSISKGEMTVD